MGRWSLHAWGSCYAPCQLNGRLSGDVNIIPIGVFISSQCTSVSWKPVIFGKWLRKIGFEFPKSQLIINKLCHANTERRLYSYLHYLNFARTENSWHFLTFEWWFSRKTHVFRGFESLKKNTFDVDESLVNFDIIVSKLFPLILEQLMRHDRKRIVSETHFFRVWWLSLKI